MRPLPHASASPATIRAVEEALAAGDALTLDRYRRFLEPILGRIAAGNPGRANQAERLLQQIDESTGTKSCR